jgi:hypothetical protein
MIMFIKLLTPSHPFPVFYVFAGPRSGVTSIKKGGTNSCLEQGAMTRPAATVIVYQLLRLRFKAKSE